jgi:hypothetical protein
MISDSGQSVEATFELEGEGSNFTLLFKADGGSGKNRLNRDYGLGLEILMRRLSSISVSLRGAYLDSSLARELKLEERRLGSAGTVFLPDADPRDLCTRIRREAASFNVPGARTALGKSGKSGGNQTRRLRLELSTPAPYDLSTLRAYLENGFGGEIERMRMAPGETAAGFARWLEMLRTGEQVGRETWYFSSHNVRVKIGPRLVDGVPIARFADAPARRRRRRVSKVGCFRLSPPSPDHQSDRSGLFRGKLQPSGCRHRQSDQFPDHGAEAAEGKPLLHRGQDVLIPVRLAEYHPIRM